jgi:hypothetical protein
MVIGVFVYRDVCGLRVETHNVHICNRPVCSMPLVLRTPWRAPSSRCVKEHAHDRPDLYGQRRPDSF